MNEFERIAQLFAPLSSNESGAFNLTDDAAILSPTSGHSFVFTKDCIIESVHFIGDESPALIAQKLLRTNLSDLAAMGATPRAYMLGLMLPRATSRSWFLSFIQGLAADQKQFGITLIGGDTTTGSALFTLSLTMIGEVKNNALLRSGAKPDDDVYVTGTLGDSVLGLELLKKTRACSNKDFHTYLTQRYFLPEPRIAIGQSLSGLATAAMDISDGLIQDAEHIARASGCSILLHAEALPLSNAARELLKDDKARLEVIATGGDDYELLFSAPISAREAIAGIAITHDTPITRIGTVHKGNPFVTLLDANARPIEFSKKGYMHR